jgi:hypothetical protein
MMSTRKHVYRQTYIVGMNVSQKAVKRCHGFCQRVRPNQNFQSDGFSYLAALRAALRTHQNREHICSMQCNGLPLRRRIRSFSHFSGLVWNNSRLRRVHSTGANPAQLNCDVSVNLRWQNYVAGTQVSTSGYISSIQMMLITQGKSCARAQHGKAART